MFTCGSALYSLSLGLFQGRNAILKVSLFLLLLEAFVVSSFFLPSLKSTKMQWKVVSLALALCSTKVDGSPADSGVLAPRQTTLPALPPPPSGCCATAAMLRFECSQLVIERLDPLVQPSVSPSVHLHQIAGGNSFQANMTPVVYNPLSMSNCTSCTYPEDFSNYWTAIFFKGGKWDFQA
jgi:hypothetical protein